MDVCVGSLTCMNWCSGSLFLINGTSVVSRTLRRDQHPWCHQRCKTWWHHVYWFPPHTWTLSGCFGFGLRFVGWSAILKHLQLWDWRKIEHSLLRIMFWKVSPLGFLGVRNQQAIDSSCRLQPCCFRDLRAVDELARIPRMFVKLNFLIQQHIKLPSCSRDSARGSVTWTVRKQRMVNQRYVYNTVIHSLISLHIGSY